MTIATIRIAALLAGTAIALIPRAGMARDAALEAAKKDEQPGRKDTQAQDEDNAAIVVTGSRIKGAEIAGEVVTLDQAAIIAAGQIDLGEAIRSLPQNFAGGQNPQVGFGQGSIVNENVNSASSANLRGLGPDATLTLLNGHRLPYDSASQGVDISAIPLAALDRIEVVPDGASALYGSDAVAGVVNVILRQDFEGIATSGQFGASTDGGYFRQQADIVGGTRWDRGGFLIAYDFAHSSDIEARQRSFTKTLKPDTSLFPSQERHAVTFSGHHALGGGVTAKVDALYSKRKSRTVGGTAAQGFESDPEVESYTIAPSLEIALGKDWQARVVGVFGRDRTHYRTTRTPLTGTATVTSGCFCNDVASADFGVEGPLFALGGGDARLALGAGFRNNGLTFTRLVNGSQSQTFDETRRSRYAYGELNLPFVSSDLAIRGIDRLTFSAALRYEDYPGLDRIATPRLGLIYAPVPSLTLRASWARSFKAPRLYQQFFPYQAFLLPAASFGAGTSPSTVLYTSGGNPVLEPERAKSWTAGFEFSPKSVDGLIISATYFNIDYRDRVVQPIAGSIAAAFRDPGFATLINRSPTPALVTALGNGAQFGVQNVSGVAFNPANVVAIVDNRNINVATQKIKGIDARIAWNGEIAEGQRLGFDLSGSWLESSQRVTPTLPVVELAGNVFSPPNYRLRVTANYAHHGFRLTSSLNYTGALKDLRFASAGRVSPSATVDLGASYDLIAEESKEPGLSVSLTINNLLNDKPDMIRVTGPTDTPYDTTNYSPIGRFVAIGIRRQW
jgi:outer membrane receptor protein involved in Fe transport